MEENTNRPILLHLAWVRWWSALAYHAYTLAMGLERIGRHSRIVAPADSPLAARAASAGLAAPEWEGLASSAPHRLLPAVRRLRDAARSGRIAGVFVHTGAGHLASALALSGGRVPLLRVRSDIRRPAGGPLQRWLYASATDRILISGEFMRSDYFDRLGIDPNRILHLPAGFDRRSVAGIDRIDARRRLRSSLGWPGEARVVGMLARYSTVKGHRDLVAAARIVARCDPRARFLVAGPEGQVGRARVEAWVRDAGLADRFAVLEAVDAPLETAAGFDVAVIASTGSEAVCRSALEYMALGVPIVASSIHVIPETVGEAGRLFAPGDARAAAEAIQELLEGSALGDPVAEGLRRIETLYDAERIATRAAEIVEEVARGK